MRKTSKILFTALAIMVLTAIMTVSAFATAVTNEEGSASVAVVNGQGYDTFDKALNAASALNGDVTVEIYDKVTLNTSLSGSYDSIKFVGMTDTAEIYLDVQGYITAIGKTVAFEDLTLSKSEGGFITNAGFMNVAFGIYHVNEVTYTNCVFANGAYASSGAVTFTDCTFYRSHDKYGLWAYGDVEATVEGCTFDDYRGIKMYSEDKVKSTELTVKDTDFSKVTDKPAIVLTYGQSVSLDGNTYPAKGAFELDLDGSPNGTTITADAEEVAKITCINDNGACGVIVDGQIYTTVAQAAEVAGEGSTVTLLHDSKETVELPEGTTLDKNGYVAENVTVNVAAVAQIGETTYATLQEAIKVAIETNANEIKILCDIRELLITDLEIVVNSDLKFVADSNVKIEFYNGGTSYDVIFNSNNKNTITISENVTFSIVDRIIWLGYYGNNVTVNVDGVLQGSQIWLGANTNVSSTGKIVSASEAFVLRRGALLSVDGGTVEANYFTILAGQIFAENNATIKCGKIGISNTDNYVYEGGVSINIWDSKLLSTSSIVSVGTENYPIYIDFYNSIVEIKLHDGVASSLDANTNMSIDGENAKVSISNITNNGSIKVYDNATLSLVGTLTNNGVVTIENSSVEANKIVNLGTDFQITDSIVKIAVLDNDNAMFVTGENTIQVEDATGSSYAIRVNDGVIFNDSYIKANNNETVRLLGSVTINGGFTCAYFQGSANGIGGTVTIEDGTVVNATYGVEFSKDYTLNGGKIYLAGGNANGAIWGCVFQSGTYTINTEIEVDGKVGEVVATAPVHFTNATATITAPFSQKNSGGEVVYIANSEVTVNGAALNSTAGVFVTTDTAKLTLTNSTIEANTVNVTGALVVDTDSTVQASTLKGAGSVAVDATSFTGTEATVISANTTGFSGSVSVVGNDKVTYEVAANGVMLKANPVAQIGETKYATLQEALDAAKAGDTVILNADIESSTVIIINKAIVFDGNEHKLTSSAARAINVVCDGNVTIKNLTINASGERAINVITYPAVLTVDNVTAVAANYTLNVATSAGAANVTVVASDLTGLNVVNIAGAGAQISVSDTKLTCDDQNDIESYAALVLNMDATNATITATNVEFVINGDSAKASNGAENGTITINGSSDEVDSAVAVIEYGDYYYTFNSLQDAFDAAKSGDEIVLIADVCDVGEIELGSGVTLNGNNHTISGNSVIKLAGEGAVSVKNVSFKDIDDGTTNEISAIYATVTDTSVITITGCTFENIDWDSIQVTTSGAISSAKVVITNNTFLANTSETIAQKRHVHIEPKKLANQGMNITVNANKFYGVEIANLTCYYLDPAKSTLDMGGNYFALDSYIGFSFYDGAKSYAAGEEYLLPLVAEDLTTDVNPVAYFTYGNFNIGYASSVATAIEKSYGTVKLLKDVTISNGYNDGETIKVTGKVTLDLNGHVISQYVKDNGASVAAIAVRAGAELTVIDSSEAKTGKISACNTAIQLEGTLNLQSGTIAVDATPSKYDINPSTGFAYAIWMYIRSGATSYPVFNMTGGSIEIAENRFEVFGDRNLANSVAMNNGVDGIEAVYDNAVVNITGGTVDGSIVASADATVVAPAGVDVIRYSGTEIVVELDDIFEFVGYSVKEGGFGIVASFGVNHESLASYEKINGAEVKFGSIFTAYDISNPAITNDLSSLNATNSYDLIITDITEEYETIALIMSMYVTIGENTSYVTAAGVGAASTVTTVTLKEVKENA